MASDPSSTKHRVDRDGVKLVGTRGPAVGWLLVSALALLGVAAWVVVRVTREDDASRARSAPVGREPIVLGDTGSAPAPARRVLEPQAKEKAASRTGEERPHVRRRQEHREASKEEEPTYTLNKPGEHAGIAAFPPAGTKPIKRGIIVPDDFELPEGYVRHYQTTDDGRRLPPVLMFHPDYEGVDAQGNPVPLPEDRLVPPDMAPPGLPIQTLDAPEQAGTSTRAR